MTSLPDCDPEIFVHGTRVATVYAESSRAIERWVRAVAEAAEARVDWRQIAGRGFVLHLGDEESRARVEAAMTLLAPDLSGEILERFETEVAR